jgi:hypothetical protein
MMSPQDVQQLQLMITTAVDSAVQATLRASAATQGQGGQTSSRSEYKVLDERGFRRMKEFAGGADAWREWEFDFKTAVKASSPITWKAMQKAEKENAEQGIVTTGHLLEGDPSGEFPDMQKRAAELFEILVGLMTGEAKTLIREIQDGDGIKAWQILAKMYSRKTMARSLRMYREVTMPKQVEMKDLIGAVAKWTGAVNVLEKEDGTLPDLVKMAALTEMCPAEIRDVLYQNIEGATSATVKEKIVSWVGNRIAAMNMPMPMDVGCVGGKPEEEEWWQEEEVDVAMIKCYTCGGQGHPARICPSSSAAGKGQVAKSYGKGDGKGKAQGKGKSYGKGKDGQKGGKGDGKGKGYQGSCFHCGQFGHKAIECPNWWKQKTAMANEVMEEMAEENAEIGGVWMIGSVEMKSEKRTRTSNRFQVLSETSDMETDSLPELVDSDSEEENQRGQEDPEDSEVDEDEEDRWISQVEEKKENVKCGMQFHVTDAKKLLASVAKMTEAGNEVRFGPNLSDNFIRCTKTGRITPMRKERGMYVIDAFFENGLKMMKGKIVVDSGAAENVMPAEVLDNVQMEPKKENVRFVAANGAEMKNYGRKTVIFIPAAVEGFNGQA